MVDIPKVETPKKAVKTFPAVRFRGPGDRIRICVPIPSASRGGYTMTETEFTTKPMLVTRLGSNVVAAAIAAEARAAENRLELIEVDEQGAVVAVAANTETKTEVRANEPKV
jgi:hypothetical protein